jgi:hypothetical protein
MTAVVNSFEKYEYVRPSGRAPARYRAKLSFLALLWDCEKGVGCTLLFLMESILHQVA